MIALDLSGRPWQDSDQPPVDGAHADGAAPFARLRAQVLALQEASIDRQYDDLALTLLPSGALGLRIRSGEMLLGAIELPPSAVLALRDFLDLPPVDAALRRASAARFAVASSARRTAKGRP